MSPVNEPNGSAATARDLVITRVLDAPRDDVWQLFSEREHAMHWWGPKGFTVPHLEMDVRRGGRWQAIMQAPDGKEYPHYGLYREILSPDRLLFTFVWEDEGPESEMLCTFTFAARGARTGMTFRKGPFRSAESQESERTGWNECFDRLAEYVRTADVGPSRRS